MEIRYGRLLFLQDLGKVHVQPSGRKEVLWEFLCECGNTCYKTKHSVLQGHTKSCGCLQKEERGKSRISHHKTKTPEYLCWSRIKTRCYNTKEKNYKDYGGRGIKVCDRWLEPDGKGFLNFLGDMGTIPSLKHSLDRIDVNGDYEPSNCRWANAQQQAANRRMFKNNTSGTNGVNFNKQRGHWTAYWYDTNGKLRNKAFSVNLYGDELSKFLAEEARQQQINLLKLQGWEYSENHGK